ncbi:MAG: FAD-dependent oxidoreductase, partial [Muribaculaceae bacterium]|nr:FAD-dependent oxidoreductase [Muribaculaceae bacterium]
MKSDLIIIGAGPGGYETALTAARRGKNVVLFNGDRLGGTCLNEGCIPTKCLCKNAEIISQFKEGEVFGIDDFSFTLDFAKIMSRKDDVVSNLRSGVDMLLKQAKVTVVNSKATFKDNHTVVADGEEYS